MGCRVAGNVREQSVSLIVPPQPQPHNCTVVSEPSFAMAASHDGTECGNLHAGPVCVLYVSMHLCCSIIESLRRAASVTLNNKLGSDCV